MTAAAWWQLLLETLRAPREVARRLMALRLPLGTLWTALALVAVLDAIVFSLTALGAAPAEALPLGIVGPFAAAALLGTGLAATAWALWWVGRGLGGRAGLGDLLVLVVWLQAVRLLFQLGLLALAPLSAALASLLALVALVVEFWIMLSFVDEAHGFGNMLKSLGVVILGSLVMAIPLAVLLALLGGLTGVGDAANV